MNGRVLCIALACASLLAPPAHADEVLRNWFKDPFFPVRDAFARCVEPLGPFETEEQMLKEAHYRSERGTRCWLEKKCAKPNSYLYDADIAAAVSSRFAASRRFRDASLWITVQRRWVWVEGCAASPGAQRELEKFVAAVPDVERVIVFVTPSRQAPPPYRTLGRGQRRGD